MDDLGKTCIDSVEAAFESCFPDVEQRFSKDLEVLDGQYFRLRVRRV